jgi:transposase
MLTVEDIEAIRRAYYGEHKSVRAIAREQHHHRRVVREAIAGTHPEPRRYRRHKPKARPVLEPVLAQINTWLEADQEAPPKQRHTAKRIYDRLVEEHGFTGGERTVRGYVAAWHQAQRSEATGYLPLAYAPGAEAQCDWGAAVVRIAGEEQEAALFCLRLCYSLKSFVCAFPAARQECFFAGHVAGFAFLGGVPARVTYDNLSSAVRKVLEGRNRQEQEAFVAFRGHYLFASHFCLPGKEGAHEKPLVETLVGYSRRNFLVPVPEMPSWEALNDHLRARCAREDGRPASGRTGTIGALWQEDVAHLRPLQAHPYPCCRTVPVRATRQGLVTFERNRYSVPSRYGGERLLLRAFPWQVEISDGQRLVARHRRLWGRGGEQLDPVHYLDLLERKPGALDLARPIQQWAPHWPPSYRTYLAALQQARPAEARREWVRVLQLHARYGEAAVAAALERAQGLCCWSADGVEQLVQQGRHPLLPASVVDLQASPTLAPLAQVQIPLPDLQRFDLLVAEVGS